MSVRLDNDSETGRPSFTLANNTTEQTVFTSSVVYPRRITVYLDLTNLTVNNTLRPKIAADGSNFRNLDTNDGRAPYAFTVATDDDLAMFGPYDVADQFRLSMQVTGAAEGATRAVPYHVVEVSL